jgi:hypothetical protein
MNKITPEDLEKLQKKYQDKSTNYEDLYKKIRELRTKLDAAEDDYKISELWTFEYLKEVEGDLGNMMKHILADGQIDTKEEKTLKKFFTNPEKNKELRKRIYVTEHFENKLDKLFTAIYGKDVEMDKVVVEIWKALQDIQKMSGGIDEDAEIGFSTLIPPEPSKFSKFFTNFKLSQKNEKTNDVTHNWKKLGYTTKDIKRVEDYINEIQEASKKQRLEEAEKYIKEAEAEEEAKAKEEAEKKAKQLRFGYYYY